MAEMTTDAQALSAASTEFDGIRSFFLFEDSASESGVGMQDTEKGVTGMFASTPVETRSGTQYQSAADDAGRLPWYVNGFHVPPMTVSISGQWRRVKRPPNSLKYNFGGIEGAADAGKRRKRRVRVEDRGRRKQRRRFRSRNGNGWRRRRHPCHHGRVGIVAHMKSVDVQ